MALTLCPERKRYLSEHAAACPHCGYSCSKPLSFSKIGEETPGLITGILLVVLIVLLFIAAFALLTQLFLLSLLFVIGDITLIVRFHSIVYDANHVTCPHCMQSGKLPKKPLATDAADAGRKASGEKMYRWLINRLSLKYPLVFSCTSGYNKRRIV